MNRFLVIGAGLIGKAIIKHHIELGDKIYWMDNESNSYLDYTTIPGERVSINIDLPYFLKYYVDIISIQASLVSVGLSTEQPQLFLDSNIAVVSKVIQAVKDCGKKIKIIHSSSMGVYGEPTILPTSESHYINPINIYGVSKAAQEEALRVASSLYNLDIIALRYFSVHGEELSIDNPNTGIINFMTNQAKTGTIIINDNGLQTRDIIDVRDVANAHYLACTKDLKGFNTINIGSGKSYALKSIAQMIDNKATIVCTGIKRPGDIVASKADISKAKALLNWRPLISLEHMIEEYKMA